MNNGLLVTAVQEGHSLQKLKLDGNGISLELSELLLCLSKCSNLENVDLSANEISKVDTCEEFIFAPTRLRIVRLDTNPITSNMAPQHQHTASISHVVHRENALVMTRS
jgi:Leucine-rich repeat (LRR) protein